MSVFQNIVNHLRATYIKLNDKLQVLLLLSSLLDNSEVLVVTLVNSTSNEKLIMSAVKNSMLNEEVKIKECGLIVTPNHSEVLVTKSRGRSKTRNFHKCDKYENPNKSINNLTTRK